MASNSRLILLKYWAKVVKESGITYKDKDRRIAESNRAKIHKDGQVKKKG